MGYIRWDPSIKLALRFHIEGERRSFKEPLLTIKVQKELYEKQGIEVLMDDYLRISAFSREILR